MAKGLFRGEIGKMVHSVPRRRRRAVADLVHSSEGAIHGKTFLLGLLTAVGVYVFGVGF